jgi:hypothetical protein
MIAHIKSVIIEEEEEEWRHWSYLVNYMVRVKFWNFNMYCNHDVAWFQQHLTRTLEVTINYDETLCTKFNEFYKVFWVRWLVIFMILLANNFM